MMSEDQIREFGRLAQARYMDDQYSRESGPSYGEWQAVEYILDEAFPEMTEEEAGAFLEAHDAEH